ncbi:TlpA disulfide reductase family protein [Flavivirga abyssicola]|uniref:TlpA family protein disulfide reductase n=1 Tax=Flavivirga abyssicola TaxID=3063533 RepID=UPI0026DEC177|nr:TlpA disulfide reductase family protein [Flavivirga sp. MEBiC07777]WVK14118.1 TlpA disulfide reductase family protein [Flavivirga sp. MEBiC07777]
MKKIIFIFLLGLACNAFAQKTIENPSFEVAKSGIRHVSKIEIYKNETRIHIHDKFMPNWWDMFKNDVFIQYNNGDDKAYLKSIIGHDLGTRIFMPKSGEKTIVLVFPPISNNVKKIDFNNEIFGISLVETDKKLNKTKKVPKSVVKWIDDELTKVATKPIENYNSPKFFNKSTARLIGYIKGYDVRLGFKTGIMYMGNPITNESYPIVVQVHSDGRFEADIPLNNPLYTYVVFEKRIINLYLEPEQTLAMILDFDEFLLADRFRYKRHKFKNIVFKGDLAQINKDLMGFDFKEFDYKSFMKKVKKLSPEEFKKEEKHAYQKNQEALSKYLANNITDKAKVLLINTVDLDYAIHLFDFVKRRNYEAKKDTINRVLKIPVKKEYYDFLKEIPLNDQSLLALDKFSAFVNRFEFCKPISIYPKGNKTGIKPEKTLLEYFEEANIKISENDKELMALQKNRSYKSYKEYQEQLKLFSEDYRNGLKAYNKKYIQPLVDAQSKPQKTAMEKWRLRDSVVSNVFNLKKNLVHDVAKIRALDFDIQRSNSNDAHEYWETLKKEITHPFLKEEGDRIVNKKFPIVSTNNNTLDGNTNTASIQAKTTKLPEGKATDIFRKIVDPFKGKILFIDFWATSCAPCVGGIKRMKDTRKEYEDNKDFDFIFITDERSSPMGRYTKFVKEQELKNIYRLSLDDYNYLRQLFRFNGIPRYVVIDKKGDVINDKFPMYNFDHLLDGILEKHK